MAILLAAATSGSGKTTVTLALLAALRRRGLRIQPFKVGPDYIDPLFHTAVSGIPCRNLDPFLTDENFVQRCFRHHCQGKDGAIVEGVMGLFDGRAPASPPDPTSRTEPFFASSAHVARLLGIPVVLVIDGSGMGMTVAALLYGLSRFDPGLAIAGVIFNQVASERHGQILQQAAAAVGIPVLGQLPRREDLRLPSRHLGLVPVSELDHFPHWQEAWADLAEQHLNWDKLLPLIRTLPPAAGELWPGIPSLAERTPSRHRERVRVGVAQDAAFNFYYADNLDLLRACGAELLAYSPLQVGLWPPDPCDGLLLGGGFPELFAATLSEKIARQPPPPAHPPLYAECGGLMVLGRSLTDLQGKTYPMAGLLPITVDMGSRLCLGYREATVLRPTLLVEAGDRLRGHEFHRSRSTPTSPSPIYSWGSPPHREGWAGQRLHASYLHLHWGSRPDLAVRLLQNFLRIAQGAPDPA
ncbi:cobyrinic acid a,c-diamide synthase [Thermostichus sp. MS-CIW-21]|jgi:cobyrinic acid a,c-diamide synthase|uniref:cobyrinate a,c-diamide synthase n=1 Tax=unclassified Synechococcus TaxID=2626047 RepID=UPI000C1A4A1E|nr:MULTISPECIES: cobyrinate a,c-diamide synthase [unclassified Synechococcus]PIK85299.1 cobyrinic acid a,c-diamide synthase [Synechococcus sp. 63AY4M2]PIK88552.1 cobyrinic acid a,c-diamide synthase [Synechococcus sp. 65AY6A5]PIK92984.1 cobyrinic acid a,c-diamide synthase [Synechococcus sp. 65AY6Li]PIK94342.1 cobyrinic acid a,c-diamide synthase [Synechococcus sp. 60AY4M2]PIK98923.1 cobyrinic acid a,c-diamide synthase [Synechococcus sp. 63AY4M1]